jgi:ABC-type nitrate/sulfonate/bicarbonate transport system ATPase subunit
MEISVEWDDAVDVSERCGVLFQQSVLLDELTVTGNLALGLKQHHDHIGKDLERDRHIKRLLDTVGLDYERDGNKKPTELSGGMARRAALALQLSQRKHMIVIDEPFTGLDEETAISVAKELVHLRKLGTALLLISHEHSYAEIVLAEGTCQGNVVVELQEPSQINDKIETFRFGKPDLMGITFYDRFWERLVDYLVLSLPLIILTFVACGLAISMLSTDTLRRIDVTDPVLKIVEKEVKPMIQLITGEEPNIMHMLGVKMKVRSMLDRTVPTAKANLYGIGMAQVFVLEIGPLLSGLLLTGRIGGSYAGKVATLRATAQTQLLCTLGISPWMWSFAPALAAGLWAGPVLTMTGTSIALVLGSYVGDWYDIGSQESYWEQVRTTVFPGLRLRSWMSYQQSSMDSSGNSSTTLLDALWYNPDFRTTFDSEKGVSDSAFWILDSAIEVITYPPVFHLLKSITYIWIILGVAEICANRPKQLTPRGVPSVITSAVVTSGLLIILADWGFSRLWLKRH